MASQKTGRLSAFSSASGCSYPGPARGIHSEYSGSLASGPREPSHTLTRPADVRTSVPDSLLIVDDNPLNVKLLRTLLAGDEYEIRTASNGQEALEILTQFHPRLILMDIQMPGMNGLELPRLLKSDSRTRD